MEPLLSIAIPTYNRAPLLDRQLAWFNEAVKGRESNCELIISDNCSSDETPDVISKWQKVFAQTSLSLQTRRHPENIGPIRNIASCINRANGRHVWTIGDDDQIQDRALGFVMDSISLRPGLALLILNFSSRHCETGELKYARCFEIDHDHLKPNGKSIVERALEDPDPTRWGGLVLTTALVYSTPLAQAALQAWPGGQDNLYLQFFVTASCAIRGQTMLTKEPFLEMSEGRHFFTGQKNMLFRFKIAELPESLAMVAELGYSPCLCLEKVRLQRNKISRGSIRRRFLESPLETLSLLRRHRKARKRIALSNRKIPRQACFQFTTPSSISEKNPEPEQSHSLTRGGTGP